MPSKGSASGGVLELVAELDYNDAWVHLGDGNTFADYMGCGVVAIDQVDLETQEPQSVVLTRANLEALLTLTGLSVELVEGTTGHYMGDGLFVVDQAQADGKEAQRIVLTEDDIAALLAWGA